jgi:hypothetical protein
MLSELEAWKTLVDELKQGYDDENYPFLYFVDPEDTYNKHYGLCESIDILHGDGLIADNTYNVMLERIPSHNAFQYVWPQGELAPRIEFCKEMVKLCEK